MKLKYEKNKMKMKIENRSFVKKNKKNIPM
jgi:hypothetical protein